MGVELLSERAREAQRRYKREYMRKWRAENKDKVIAINARYWEKKAAKMGGADSNG